MITVSNGHEFFRIPEADLQEARQDGFYVPAERDLTIVSNGIELFEVPLADVEEAQQDGFRDVLIEERLSGQTTDSPSRPDDPESVVTGSVVKRGARRKAAPRPSREVEAPAYSPGPVKSVGFGVPLPTTVWGWIALVATGCLGYIVLYWTYRGLQRWFAPKVAIRIVAYGTFLLPLFACIVFALIHALTNPEAKIDGQSDHPSADPRPRQVVSD